MVFNEKICKIKTFDVYSTLETRGVFLDMSKAFDKVWQRIDIQIKVYWSFRFSFKFH